MNGIDAVAVLQRWEDSGAHWAVVFRGQGEVTVALYRCDGGEEVDRFTSSDPALRAFLGDRASNFD
ncbi:MAG: hypothetical protein JO152_17495 [Mycobacteriaceae bacterium]|nr:hypothetical protein [Mycobacteriaceae bacterium]